MKEKNSKNEGNIEETFIIKCKWFIQVHPLEGHSTCSSYSQADLSELTFLTHRYYSLSSSYMTNSKAVCSKVIDSILSLQDRSQTTKRTLKRVYSDLQVLLTTWLYNENWTIRIIRNANYSLS